MITYRYLGGGYLHGIPARDLTEEEAVQFADILASETGKQLYEAVTPATSAEDTAVTTTEEPVTTRKRSK